MDEAKKDELIDKIDAAFDHSQKGRRLKAAVEQIAECSAPSERRGGRGATARTSQSCLI